MKKFTKWLLGIIILLVVIVFTTVIVVKNKEYSPSSSAISVAKTSQTVNGTIKFPGQKDKPRVIFYPGALVSPKSYSIWASRVAQAGFSVYIVQFPLDLAVLNVNAANKVHNQQPYVIGGHSLGGTMASRYAKNHQKNLRAVFFLASYPEKKGDLHEINVPVLSLTATNDGVLNQSHYKQAKKLLPNKTIYQVIQGGNHAGFGSYGRQKGDNKATITNRKQQILISNLLIKWLKQSVRE
ncbi:alpha/beta hydrolase [Companilactobacillus halodurans]|uniref:Alpha/beta hydrolase n=1 Tax=Companilactobacillus halodurans TaxID=2584183 RepID=A0A5P0ZVG9_9LACO|nr:alpha/beta family hydrolase [Companilactobacillus halodurans]MQS76366.1 alpha/beta hydrolase [Companilactobacillus halodurans]MQS96990.1 alpha/beta hydrolase [Companilactobacillus halodurans]